MGVAAGVCALTLGVALLSTPSTTMLASATVPRVATRVSAPAAIARPLAAPVHATMGDVPQFDVPADEEIEDAFYQSFAAPEAPAGTATSWVLGAISTTVAALFFVYRRWATNLEAEIAAYEAQVEATLDARAWRMAQVVGEMPASTGPSPVRVVDSAGASAGEQTLNLKTAGLNSKGLVHKKLVAELANRRQANAHTKTRAEVSGGGKKPYAQKGTGNARRGSSRSPLLRGGGVAFGPRNNRNYKQVIPQPLPPLLPPPSPVRATSPYYPRPCSAAQDTPSPRCRHHPPHPHRPCIPCIEHQQEGGAACHFQLDPEPRGHHHRRQWAGLRRHRGQHQDCQIYDRVPQAARFRA